MIKGSPIYNEPLLNKRGDRLPKLRQIGRLHPIVKARLQLESALRICGNDSGKPLKLSKMHIQVLLAMLSETDSPFSASLRARSAGVVGIMKIKKSAKILRQIALNDNDIQTRLNAIDSFIRISGYVAMRDVEVLVENKNKLVRVATYIAALKSSDLRLSQETEKLFWKELDESVRHIVTLRVPKIQSESTTQSDTRKS